MKRIGDILTRNKLPISVQDDVSYKQVTIRTNYKGVELRGEQFGSAIGTKSQWVVSAGQFILSRIDARNGAFGIVPEELEGAIVTNDFLAFDVNEDIVEREFFNVFLQSPVFLDACIKSSKGNTNRKRVDENFLMNYQVALPPLEEQKKLISKVNKGRANLGRVTHEIRKQESILAILKDSILEEAMNGSITQAWRLRTKTLEGADTLYKKIRDEKKRISTEHNLKAEKFNHQIELEEVPHQIPDSWKWCRLGAVTRFFDYRGKTPNKQTSGIRLITAKNVKKGFFSDLPRDYISEKSYENHMVRGFPENGDILFTTEAPLGNACQLDYSAQFALGQRLITIQPLFSNKKYFLYALLSKSLQKQFLEKSSGITAKGIKSGRLVDILIPLPPLKEQDAIVERVDALIDLQEMLVARVTHLGDCAEALQKAILRDVFLGSRFQQG